MLAQTAVDVAAMANSVDRNQRGIRIYLVHNAVVSNTQPIHPLGTLQFHG